MTTAAMDRLLIAKGKVFVVINAGPNAGKTGTADNMQNGSCRVKLANSEGTCWILAGDLSLPLPVDK